MDHIVFLSLGTNLGNRSRNLDLACKALPPQVELLVSSPIYETEPWGYADQPAFLNQVLKAKTTLPPEGLLAHVKEIEARLGRQPTFRYGPRIIDIDILLYDNLVYETPALTIPHPRLAERPFVLVPLLDLDPDLRLPGSKVPLRTLLAGQDSKGVRRYIRPGTPKELEP